MKVRMTGACVDEVREYSIGDVVEVSDVKAERFIKAGLAEKYEEPVKPKPAPPVAAPQAAAVEPVSEKATMPFARKRPT